jgi:hypothetical protein
VPFEYEIGKEFTREELPKDGTALADGRFVVLTDRILGFLEYSELQVEDPQQLVWTPPSNLTAWLPEELRDGTDRARRGIALFIRQEKAPWIYQGRAELTHWPVDPQGERKARLTLDKPLPRPARKLSPAAEEALRGLDGSDKTKTLLRWASAGDPESWSELSEDLCHQGEVSGTLVPLLPFLLKLLEDPEFPYREDLLWILALAPKAPPYIAQAATSGEEVYRALLDQGPSELRRPAAFALQSCAGGRDRFRAALDRERDESLRGVLLASLAAPGSPDLVSFFLQEMRSGQTPFLKAIAAVAAIHSSPDAPPPDAVRHLREQELTWERLEDDWQDLDPAGAAILDPQTILDRLSYP